MVGSDYQRVYKGLGKGRSPASRINVLPAPGFEPVSIGRVGSGG